MVINVAGKCKNEFVGIVGESLRIQASDGSGGCCMKEVEEVMEELSRKGEFAFGSFWCNNEDQECDEIFPTCHVPKHEEFGDGFVSYHLINMVGSISCS